MNERLYVDIAKESEFLFAGFFHAAGKELTVRNMVSVKTINNSNTKHSCSVLSFNVEFVRFVSIICFNRYKLTGTKLTKSISNKQ